MGPLHGVKVLEISGIGPGPFAAMMLSDMGADVLRLYRADQPPLLGKSAADTAGRGRSGSVPVNLKSPEGIEQVLSLAERADVLMEGMRPGVMERLGLGPDVVLARNPRIVYGRMTGYGQDGPMSKRAGHDINYIALAGALGQFAREGERPMFPLNLVGDYGGGGMLLAFGIVCAVLEAKGSGHGQVVDAAMVEGAALLTTMLHGMKSSGMWNETPGTNVLDSGAHFYEVYTASDGGHVAVGAIEPQFYAKLLEVLEIPAEEMPQWDQSRWGEFKQRLTGVFAGRTRAEWAELFEPVDACVTAVYGFSDAPQHPHNVARSAFVEHDGVVQPAPAPRFSRTPAAIEDRDAEQALSGWGFSPDEIAKLTTDG